MLEQLQKQMKLTDEVLDNLPANNEKNKSSLVKEVEIEINNYQIKLNEIIEELNNRQKKYENLEYEQNQDQSEILFKLKQALRYTNNLSTSYEKLNLDKIVYSLAHYQEEDLVDSNQKILKAINIFKKSNVPLTPNDFNYTQFVNDYTKMFFQENLTIEKSKQVFDEIYWKCPTIMTQIELNLRHLYLKNQSKTEAYIQSINKQITEKFKNASTSILNDYNYLRTKQNNFISKNNLILDFYNQKMDIDLYSDDKIEPIISSLFQNKDYDSSKIDIIKQMKNSLVEYKNYLKYKDLIDKIKELYKETVEKDFLNQQLKKVKDNENKLFKLDKKYNRAASKTSVNKLEPEINNLIEEIKKTYDEIDSNIFKIIVKKHIHENSTIFKSLLLICQYYTVLADYFKEKDPEATNKEIDERIDDLYNFTMDPNNTIINNITVLEEKELSTIIITNYKMLNINIDETLMTLESIDGLIEDLDKVIINNTLKQLDISIKELQESKQIKETLEKK